MKFVLLCAMAFGVSSMTFSHAATVTGIAYDSQTSEKISGAFVGVFDQSKRLLPVEETFTTSNEEKWDQALSDATGKFRLIRIKETSNNIYKINITKLGYASYSFDLKIPKNGSVNINLPMHSDDVSVAPINTISTMGDRYLVLAPAITLDRIYNERKSNISKALLILSEYCRKDVLPLTQKRPHANEYYEKISLMKKELNFQCEKII